MLVKHVTGMVDTECCHGDCVPSAPLFSGEFEVYRLVRYHITVSLQHHVLFCNVL